MKINGCDLGCRGTTAVYFIEKEPQDLPAHKASYTWYPGLNNEYSISTRWHKEATGALAELHSLMDQLGYRKPKWWQWWRWKEKKLPFSQSA